MFHSWIFFVLIPFGFISVKKKQIIRLDFRSYPVNSFLDDNVLQRTNQFSHIISCIQIAKPSGSYPLNITVSSSANELPEKCTKDFSYIANLTGINVK